MYLEVILNIPLTMMQERVNGFTTGHDGVMAGLVTSRTATKGPHLPSSQNVVKSKIGSVCENIFPGML